MKYLMPTTALASLFFAANAMASSLEIPLNFEYLALDGKEISTNSFKHQAQLELDAGTRKIAIRFHDMVQDQFSDSQSFVKSSPFIITLDVLQDTNYQLAPATALAQKDPQQYAQSPAITITSNNHSAVDYQYVLTSFEEPSFFNRLFSGGQSSNTANDIAAATSITTSAAIEASEPQVSTYQTTVAAQTTAASAASKPAPAESARAEQMLQYWWLQADEQTRKEFMSWAIKQL
ncbi:DUF2057 domain-containing protein [Shewanella sp. NIFS-20-20]|uniref:DUF2057 domain-containing protein n=1 Tax=Shewanella sp. NIFS-20-20 TaxID=2853806 RepID=UPI001C442210|nr:DUF2057 domain-containing protein [Shewanella sp. NIFS-20-20]MBV7315950.1 DUF2057 domain-containing protein [Shewanella sp. NIFS-20-20]